MTQGAELAGKITALVFVTTSMASAGLSVRPADLLGQLRRGRLVAAALLANFAAAPLIAWGLGRLIPIDPAYAAGLLLIGGAAGAPILPKLAERARANVAFSVALMMLLVVGTVAYLPLVMPLVLPGLRASPLEIAHPLILLIVLPLGAGMLVRGLWEPAGRRAEPVMRRVSDAALLVFVVVIIATHLGAIWGAVGSGAILAAILFVIACGAVAFALGPADAASRRVLALGTAQRNVAAAIVTAGSSFAEEPKVLVMVLVTDIVGVVMLLVAVRLFRRSGTAGEQSLSVGS